MKRVIVQVNRGWSWRRYGAAICEVRGTQYWGVWASGESASFFYASSSLITGVYANTALAALLLGAGVL